MIDETTRQQKSSPEKWLISSTRAVRSDLIRSLVCSFGAALLILLQAWLLSLACHRLIIEKAAFPVILPLLGWVMLASLLRGLMVYVAECCSAAVAAGIKIEVRSQLYRRFVVLGPAGRAGEETGSLVEAVTAGIEGLEPYVSRFLPHAVLAAVLPVMALACVLPFEGHSALVLLFSAPFIPLFMVLIGKGAESLNRHQWGRLARMAGHLLDLVQGLPDLKICSAARREAEAVARVSEEYRQSTMAVLRVAFLSAFTLEFFATVGTAVVAVVVGFRLLNGSLSLHHGLFVLLLAPEFYLPLRTLGLSYHARMQGLAAAEKIAPLLAVPLPEKMQGKLPVPDGLPVIRFEKVVFRYAGIRGGVNEVDLELPPGSVTALVGESGSGKTTLARLLIGLAQPEEGRVTVNGVDLALFDGNSWRERIAWVPQKPFFFKGSIRENLLLGRPGATDPEILTALDAAAALQFVSALPAGLDTDLGDRGAGLSGGELRRMALARAFLRNSSLLVLDEPTAGLDLANEILVSEALQRLAVGRTVLVISHRETTIRSAQRVAVMAGGRVVQVMIPGEYLAAEPAI